MYSDIQFIDSSIVEVTVRQIAKGPTNRQAFPVVLGGIFTIQACVLSFMDPHKAHRTLNTALLVIIMAMVSLNTGDYGSGVGAHLIELTLWGSILVLILLGFRILGRNVDEIREYLEIV